MREILSLMGKKGRRLLIIGIVSMSIPSQVSRDTGNEKMHEIKKGFIYINDLKLNRLN